MRELGADRALRRRLPLFVLSGVAVFALTIRSFGLIPAVVVGTMIWSFAELKVTLVGLPLLRLALGTVAYLIFGVELRLPIAMVLWPF